MSTGDTEGLWAYTQWSLKTEELPYLKHVQENNPPAQVTEWQVQSLSREIVRLRVLLRAARYAMRHEMGWQDQERNIDNAECVCVKIDEALKGEK